MSGYPPYGPYYPPPHGHYPPPPPPPSHLPPGSFTYLPPAYSYQPPPPQWSQTYYQPPQTPTQPYFHPPTPTQPYFQPTPQPQNIEPPTPTQPTEPPNFTVNVVEQPEVNPDPEPATTPVQDAISWVPATPTNAQSLDYKAVVGGKEGYDGSLLWVIRAHHKGELVPGKLNIKHRYAYIPSVGKEVPVHNFEVLCTKPGCVQWLSSKNGQVPEKAIEAGYTLNAEPLYIGRVTHKSSLTPGKVQPSHNCCYISYHGMEISFRKYQVLCQVI